MSGDFHNKDFSHATLTKLEIFRSYITEWLPVFFTKKDRFGNSLYRQINVFDFFAGPGKDGQGILGSPLIIQEELKNFCFYHWDKRNSIPVRLFFNDSKKWKIDQLKINLQEQACKKKCCSFEFGNESFNQAIQAQLPIMRRKGHANLILLDQCGVKEVTPSLLKALLDCGNTDVLFFMSTSVINRFKKELCKPLEMDPEELEDAEYNTIHRLACEHFRNELSDAAYVAPFSLKKGSNIYGVIFASSHLLGLEKFLKICWKMDSITGQANYNIDNDVCYGGQATLFDDLSKPTKINKFEKALLEYIRSENPNNPQLYRFCLEQGFCKSKANDVLRELQLLDQIRIVDKHTREVARKGSFYLDNPNKLVLYSAT